MNTRCQDGRRKLLDGLIAIVVLMVTLLSAEARGATYYLAPTGSDSGPGTSSASPWKTFSFAVPKLSPGDTLILANGTYNGGNSGYPSIHCGTNATNGTAAQQITVKAENERQAFLKGTGHQSPLFVSDCAYWTFEGLRVESADASGSTSGGPIFTIDSNHLTIRRMLVSHNNRYANSSVILLYRTNSSLVEENEVYSYHRHGIIASGGDNNIIRRNYVNSRNTPDIAGGRASGIPDRGDGGIALYPGSNNIVENNVVENVSLSFNIEASSTALNNKFLGNISLNNHYGAVFRSRGDTLVEMPRDNLLENHVALNSTYYGGYFRSSKNTQCHNCTSLNNRLGGFAADTHGDVGDGKPSFFATNSLAVNNASYGFLMVDQSDFSFNNSNSFGQRTNFSPTTRSKVTGPSDTPTSIDPELGSCLVFLPDSSPMKGAGTNGADKGANVLYRYQDGALTNIPLWNDTGEFPCGAIVPGVNDVAGSSCFDVHQRLNVNTNGCSFPAGYGMGVAPPNNERPLPPTNLRVL